MVKRAIKTYLFLVSRRVHSIVSGQQAGPFNCFWSAGGSIQLFLVSRRVHSIVSGQQAGPFNCFWSAGGSIQLFLVSRRVHSIVSGQQEGPFNCQKKKTPGKINEKILTEWAVISGAYGKTTPFHTPKKHFGLSTPLYIPKSVSKKNKKVPGGWIQYLFSFTRNQSFLSWSKRVSIVEEANFIRPYDSHQH